MEGTQQLIILFSHTKRAIIEGNRCRLEMTYGFLRIFGTILILSSHSTLEQLAAANEHCYGCHFSLSIRVYSGQCWDMDAAMSDGQETSRVLGRNETHDLSMIIKERTKVLRAHADEQAAACMADFEKKLAAIYSWDQDETWKAAAEESMKVVKECQDKVSKRCEELGIPKTFAPRISAGWEGRGENAVSARRAELRKVAKSSVDAMTKAAITKIEKQSLDLRTQIVGMALLSPEAKMFLESLAPVDEAMQSLDFHEVEKRLEREHQQRIADNKIGYYGRYG
jgi:hypothetical protein